MDTTQCFRETRGLGVDWITDVCSGRIAAVPWSSTDWLLFLFTAIFAVVFLATVINMWRDISPTSTRRK